MTGRQADYDVEGVVKDLTVHDDPEGVPVFSLSSARVEEALEHFRLFEELKTRLLNPARDAVFYDKWGKIVPCGDPRAVSSYIRKSGWLTLGWVFNVNFDPILNADGEWGRRDDRHDDDGDYYVWSYPAIVRVGGRSMPVVGVATSRDPFFTKGGKRIADEANVMLKAQTVAYNRGISALVAGGELSAEEMEGRVAVTEDPGELTDADLLGMAATETVGFGKHKGETLAFIMGSEPSYIEWLAGNDFEPRTSEALVLKHISCVLLKQRDGKLDGADGEDEKKQPPPAPPAPEIDHTNTPLMKAPGGVALGTELVFRGTGNIELPNKYYTPPEGLQPLWPGDTPKFNGHVGKHFLGEQPADHTGRERDKVLKLTYGQAKALLAELVARAGLLEMLPAVATVFEEKTGGVVKGDVALAKVISNMFGSAHGKTWRKWERAVRDELQPKEIFELQGKIVDGVLFTAVDLSGAADEEETVTEIETTLGEDGQVEEDIVNAIFGDQA